MKLALKRNKVFVQIGTNDGDDQFRLAVKRFWPSRVVLVEPNAGLNEAIRKNYGMIDGMQPNRTVFIENVVITDTEKGEQTLVIPNEEHRGGNHYTSRHFTLLPMDNWGTRFRHTLKAPSMTFAQLCRKYNIADIHLLQIDTEGYDAQIIRSIDFGRVNIDVLWYEIWDFPTAVYRRHGEAAEHYGVNGMNEVAELLLNKGYKLHTLKRDIIATKDDACWTHM